MEIVNCNVKEIPLRIQKLINLRNFDLSGNRIKVVPDAIENLIHLNELDLSKNRIRNLPEECVYPISLTKVFLQCNKLKEMPESLEKLPNLKVLDLSSNKFSKLGLYFSKMENLKELDLSNNFFEQIPISIGSTTALETLSLSNNRIRDLEYISDKLKAYRKAHKNDYTSFWPTVFPPLKLIICFAVSFQSIFNPLRPDYPLSYLKELKKLSLSNNKITDIDYLESINEKLEFLDFSYNRITNQSL